MIMFGISSVILLIISTSTLKIPMLKSLEKKTLKKENPKNWYMIKLTEYSQICDT